MSTHNGRTIYQAGFDLHPIELRAARATPGKWRDGFVTAVHPDGGIDLTDFHTGEQLRLWHSRELTAELVEGTPVAVHRLYGVLAVNGTFVSVAARPALG